jgi:dihydropteroate synthase
MRPFFEWNIGSRKLELGPRTLIMGVVNVTPDSFSDGGRYFDRDLAVDHALHLLDEGADIIDVGGESTRPGATVTPASGAAVGSRKTAVTEEEELRRAVPVIDGVKRAHHEALISIDTYKAGVAKAAVEAGAEIVNDVSAFRWDTNMSETVGGLKCGVVLMHMRGRPEEWRTLPTTGDIVKVVSQELAIWSDAAMRAGVARNRIALDPGFGFGKNFEENYPLLARFEELHQLGFPLLAGTSRKSFIGRTLQRNGHDAPTDDRLFGTLATETALVLKGAHIIRTHEVRPARDAARVADAILATANWPA